MDRYLLVGNIAWFGNLSKTTIYRDVDDKQLADIVFSDLAGNANIKLHDELDSDYELRRDKADSLFGEANWSIVRNGQIIATANKPSMWNRKLTVNFEHEHSVIRPQNMFSMYKLQSFVDDDDDASKVFSTFSVRWFGGIRRYAIIEYEINSEISPQFFIFNCFLVILSHRRKVLVVSLRAYALIRTYTHAHRTMFAFILTFTFIYCVVLMALLIIFNFVYPIFVLKIIILCAVVLNLALFLFF